MKSFQDLCKNRSSYTTDTDKKNEQIGKARKIS